MYVNCDECGATAHEGVGLCRDCEEKVLAARKLLPDVETQLLDLVRRAKTFVEFDARMAADLSRFAPLPLEEQAKHDSTETESEKWLADYERLMEAIGEKQ